MGIGISVFLIAIGLILALATNIDISGLDLAVVGWILAAAGVLGLVMEFVVWGPRRRSTVTRGTSVGPAGRYEEQVVRDERL